jgi:hypothetical protein
MPITIRPRELSALERVESALVDASNALQDALEECQDKFHVSSRLSIVDTDIDAVLRKVQTELGRHHAED